MTRIRGIDVNKLKVVWECGAASAAPYQPLS